MDNENVKVNKSNVLRTSQMKTYLEPKEVERIEQAAECLRDKLLVRLLSHLGCRVSEALGITVSDIDFDQGTVAIVHLKKRIKLSCPNCKARLSRTARFCQGCGTLVEQAVINEREHRRHRVLPVDDDTLNILREYITRRGPVVVNGHRMLFGMTRHNAWYIIKNCAQRAGLEKLVNRETGGVKGISPRPSAELSSFMA